MDRNVTIFLNCTSTGSPALNVVWTKDGVGLLNDTLYDSTHGRQYMCRVTTPYGTQEENVTILINGLRIIVVRQFTFFFTVPQTAIMTSVSSLGPAVAGYNFTLTCMVTLIEGLQGTPNVSRAS